MLPFLCPLEVKELLLHGNRGSGKTDIMLIGFAQHVGWRGWGPHWRGMIFKRTVPETETLFEKAKALFTAAWPGVKYTTHPYKVFRWPTGEMLTIRHMFDIEDYNAIHGSEIGFSAFDEVTNWPTPEVYLRSLSLLRSSHEEVSKHLRCWVTTNPGGPGHCVPYGEVLTSDRGWVDIKEMHPGDTVVTVDAAGAAKSTAITDVVRESYCGDMLTRKGRGIHMEFTPNHRLPHVNNDGFTIKPYTELPGQAFIKACADNWLGQEMDSFTVPSYPGRVRLQQPDTLTGKDYAELMGWFLSEGCTIDRDKAFAIAQMKEHGRKEIESLLTRCGFRFSTSDKQFTVYSAKWWNYFRQFGKCRDKFIPRELLESGPQTLRALLRTLMMGDGSGDVYYTTSKQLADDVCEIGVKLGRRTYLSSRQRPNRRGLSYQVGLCSPKPIEMMTGQHVYDVSTVNKRMNVSRAPFDGTVYCLTVPETETFFIRQNGAVWLSGNTWVKKRWQLPQMDKKIIYDDIDSEELARWSKDPLVNIRSRPRMSVFIDVRLNDIFMRANPTYLADLAKQAPNDAVRRAWIDGDWSVVAGGLVDDVWSVQHHVVDPFPIPRGWKIDRSMDWGSSTPFCVLWYAESDGSDYVDAEGNWRSSVAGDIFVIREWYGTNGQINQGLKLTATEVAKGIIEKEIEWGIYDRVVPGPADNQIHTQIQRGQNIASDMLQDVRLDDGRTVPGVRWKNSDKASGSRITGWNMIRDRLKRCIPDKEKPQLRELPGLFFFSTLKHTLQHFPVTPRDEKNPDDIPTKGEYHIQDTLRYRILADGRDARMGSTTGLY